MNGADRLCAALLAHGVDTCFANPGTSEMHFVAALDRRTDMRCVLGLFEGVVTGAADGYGRMRDRPAATLLHLGPGLANGLANLHNARRAGTPMINIVGDHSTAHLPLDAPLTSDIESLARPMSNWVRRMSLDTPVETDVAEAWTASLTKGIATLILPADVAWTEAGDDLASPQPSALPLTPTVDTGKIAHVAQALKQGRKVGFVLSGKALRADALAQADRIAVATGTKLFALGNNSRIERGGGRVPIQRLSNFGETGRRALASLDMIVLVSAREPVTFFGYPGQAGRLAPQGCEIFVLAVAGDDLGETLAELADRVAGRAQPSIPRTIAAGQVDAVGRGDLTVAAVNRIVANRLPENAIVCDEAITSTGFYEMSFDGAQHDYLQITGGAIGIGIPMATGAAVACPDRRVVTLQADGSGMYTLQGLWTQARENLDIVTVIFANRRYAILQGEMRRMGIEKPGANATLMLDIDKPTLDWTLLARGMGVAAEQATTVEQFDRLFEAALRHKGPFLIEAIVD